MTNRTTNEAQYLDLLRHIRTSGKDRPDRTGTGVRGLFGFQHRFDLRDQFPLLTTKKIDLRSVASELLWFLEGSGDERRLAEIRYGRPRAELDGKRTIWTDNATADYWVNRKQGSQDYWANGPEFEGDLGRVYGVIWRDWQSPRKGVPDGNQGLRVVESTDQIANLVCGLRDDPYGRRHILTAWNPGELDQMALPPCHILAQFYVDDGELSCMMTQRSNDILLGSPYNIASYALLTYMLAQVCGLTPGDFIYSQGDAHLYHNHFDAADEQLSRTPKDAPRLILDPAATEIEHFTMESFTLEGYDCHPAIRAKMAV